MGQLMPDDVERGGEPIEQLPVAVAIDDLPAIPQGVVEAAPVVDGGLDAHPPVVDGIAVENVREEVVCLPAAVERLDGLEIPVAARSPRSSRRRLEAP